MRKTLTVLLAISATACTVQVTPSQSAPTTTPVETTAAPTTSTSEVFLTTPPTEAFDPEQEFVRDVLRETSLGSSLTTRQIIDFGWAVCDYLVTGGTGDGVIDLILQAGSETGASEQIMLDYAGASGLAVAWLCPDQSWKIG
jgi:hypothetical protein